MNMHINQNRNSYVRKFFALVSEGKKFPDTSILLITHLVPGREETFIQSLSEISPISVIIPKPNSWDAQEIQRVSSRYTIFWWNRQQSHKIDVISPELLKVLLSSKQKLIILDIGGYCAPFLNKLSELLRGKLIGVVEDTENGLQRYLKLPNVPCPIIHVARSPLKEPEDHLVGHSCYGNLI